MIHNTPYFHDAAATQFEELALSSTGTQRSHYLSLALVHRLLEMEQDDRDTCPKCRRKRSDWDCAEDGCPMAQTAGHDAGGKS